MFEVDCKLFFVKIPLDQHEEVDVFFWKRDVLFDHLDDTLLCLRIFVDFSNEVNLRNEGSVRILCSLRSFVSKIPSVGSVKFFQLFVHLF